MNYNKTDCLPSFLIDSWQAFDTVTLPVVAFWGQPGSGKSSTLKKILGSGASLYPKVGLETDATDWLRDSPLFFHTSFISFMDTPGYGTKKYSVSDFIDLFPFSKLALNIFFVSGKIYSDDVKFFKKLIESRKRICLVRSFSDSLEKESINLIVNDLRKSFDFQGKIIFLSNKNNIGYIKLKEWIRNELNF
ncbi:GTPase domain-containing protein [Comamonas sp. Y33R10-2]|uniref:GTPase domain-containing protein n=1 Tax=Comamonas sp. Y33R10-2 TaxID=2853257 RepID=UPI001C5C8DCA|nr:GTPase domain-containing protein [Comamonas sp. Y33R10-2]QXZ10700.1 GTPase domain-containing protein [Comamonas sp. Y33R10-2]